MSDEPSESFRDRLRSVFTTFGRLCVGIDPHAHLLEAWGLPDSAAGAREFGLAVVEASAGQVGILKPQVAFFERFGAAGYSALEEVIRTARARGYLVIADAKRGDIGTSIDAYAAAWLAPGSPLEYDAMTVSAFQGVGSLVESMRSAERSGKGLFVLAATSNPEASAIQRATTNDVEHSNRSVARAIIDDVAAFNDNQPPHSFGSVGVVLGATLELDSFGIDTRHAPERNPMPVLAPGFGAQGAQVSELARIYGDFATATIISESRSLLGAGPAGMQRAVASRAEEVRGIGG